MLEQAVHAACTECTERDCQIRRHMQHPDALHINLPDTGAVPLKQLTKCYRSLIQWPISRSDYSGYQMKED